MDENEKCLDCNDIDLCYVHLITLAGNSPEEAQQIIKDRQAAQKQIDKEMDKL